MTSTTSYVMMYIFVSMHLMLRASSLFLQIASDF